MSESKKYPSDYSCIIFFKDRQPIKIPYVNGVYYLHTWLLRKGLNYHYINIYHRKTGRYISRQYVDEKIINRPYF